MTLLSEHKDPARRDRAELKGALRRSCAPLSSGLIKPASGILALVADPRRRPGRDQCANNHKARRAKRLNRPRKAN